MFRFASIPYVPVRGCPGLEYYVKILHNSHRTPDFGIVLKLKVPKGMKVQADYTIKVQSQSFSKNISDEYDRSCHKTHYIFDKQKILDSARDYFIRNRMVLDIAGKFTVKEDNRNGLVSQPKDIFNTPLNIALAQENNITLEVEGQQLRVSFVYINFYIIIYIYLKCISGSTKSSFGTLYFV